MPRTEYDYVGRNLEKPRKFPYEISSIPFLKFIFQEKRTISQYFNSGGYSHYYQQNIEKMDLTIAYNLSDSSYGWNEYQTFDSDFCENVFSNVT